MICVSVATLLTPCIAAAQPSVTVTAEMRNNFRCALFTFLQDDVPSMDGCHYNLFAADNRSDLSTLPGVRTRMT